MPNKYLIFRYLAIIVYFTPHLVLAQQEEEDFFSLSPAELASIPVAIATGTPKPVAQSASVISVITAEQIQSMGATDLSEVINTLPGIHGSVQGISYDTNYSVRGMRNEHNSQMLMLLNGTRISTPFLGSPVVGLIMPTNNIARIEVIRGPGSALYGADAFAGVINIITKKADDINGTTLGVRAGSSDTQSAWIQNGDHWAGWDVAASLQYQHSQGDRSRVIRGDTQSYLDDQFHSHASNAPGPMSSQYKAFNAHLALQRKHWDMGLWIFNSYDAGVRAGLGGVLDPSASSETEQYLGDVRFSTDDWFEHWELKAHASFLHTSVPLRSKIFPNGAKLPINASKNIDLTENGSITTFPNGITDQSVQTHNIPALELTSIYRGLNQHLLQFISGFRYEEITLTELKNFGDQTIDLTGKPGVYLPDTHRSIWSFAFQDEWQFAENWQLTAGVRYDRYSDFGGTINPRAALIWTINPRLITKLMYGEAFRAPSFTEQHLQNKALLRGNSLLEPETINTYEWAIDYRPLPSVRTAANFYYYQIEDLIVTKPDNRGGNTFQNSENGTQDGYGTELEWSWQINEQLNVSGNHAWQHAITPATERRVAGVPEHQVYFAAAWQFLPQWQFQSQLNWLGGRPQSDLDNALNKQKGYDRSLNDYQTVDFTLRGKKLMGHIDLIASLRNAFDARYREPTIYSFRENLPMPGRSFYLEASFSF